MSQYFNLKEGDPAFAKQKNIFCLVIYDIMSSKTRVKLSQLLTGYGLRVQKSCFEMQLSEIEYRSLVLEIEKLTTKIPGDSIIIYKCRKDDVYSFCDYQSVEIEPECIFL
ncbi:CRISPR-associated endonuclease Cas2 [Streptococcus uberis]|uniref:CRISPR-associated endonuclease Cas2 n=1 Tax=Streptococcus uberis TaxID=1349 RepID=UPI0027DCC3BC|nr:CRISPR-associated endonuclease Cas2 [Streptococcus uberis]MCK1241766.1 CRISPR-associated endonuclease Cas2 [Streptococcus uberis]